MRIFRTSSLIAMSISFCAFLGTAIAQDTIVLSAKNCSVNPGDESKVAFTSGFGGFVYLVGGTSTNATATLFCSIPYADLRLCGAAGDLIKTEVRYKDAGSGSSVQVSLFSYDIDNGAGDAFGSFVSDDHAQSSSFRKRHSLYYGGGDTFCDSTKAYYARIDISRDGQSVDPAFGALRISID